MREIGGGRRKEGRKREGGKECEGWEEEKE